MWWAVVHDFLADPAVRVVSTWDARLGRCPLQDQRLEVVTIDQPGDDREVCRQLARDCDAAIVIAPETDDVLRQRCADLRSLPLRRLNCDDPTLEICSDKWLTFLKLRGAKIPTIETHQLDDHPTAFPVVVKLRDGAGSQDMDLLRSEAEWRQWRAGARGDFLWQPYVLGRNLSLAGIFQQGELISWLPVTEQLLSSDDKFAWQGSLIPAPGISQVACGELCTKVAEAIRLHGYVGFDLLWPNHAAGPVVVEVNPRMTSSYVGCSQLYGPLLGACLLRGTPLPRRNWTQSREFRLKSG